MKIRQNYIKFVITFICFLIVLLTKENTSLGRSSYDLEYNLGDNKIEYHYNGNDNSYGTNSYGTNLYNVSDDEVIWKKNQGADINNPSFYCVAKGHDVKGANTNHFTVGFYMEMGPKGYGYILPRKWSK